VAQPSAPGIPLLAMDQYIGAVMCVKWSSEDGKYLATGSDDMIVMIWQLDRQVNVAELLM
jgi:protein HIRA/HIR1